MTMLPGDRKWEVGSRKWESGSVRGTTDGVSMERTIHSRTWQLLNILADGEFHSGEVLAERLGVSRASVVNALAGVAE